MKPYQDCIIYGPYEAKDARLRIFCIFSDGTKKTVSYPKYIMERFLNRYLESWETVHHLDHNPMNNEISNLKVLSRSEHARLDAVRSEPKEFVCPACGTKFIKKGLALHKALYNARYKNCKTYCSKSCAGRHTYVNHWAPSPRLSLNEETH